MASLFFIEGHSIARIALFLLGAFYIAILGKEFYRTREELKEYLYKK